MSEASENSSTSGGEHEPITVPDWLPKAVARQARLIEARCSSEKQRAILLRLATDGRMRGVWGELTRRERRGDRFLHPAHLSVTRCLEKSVFTQDQIQQEALSELFHFVFCATGDEVPVSKTEEVSDHKTMLLLKAKMLREIADDLAANYPDDPLAATDITALRRVARLHETIADTLRPTTDPLTIRHDRGDRVVRGVQILIAASLRETFGKPLDGTAATLASVALDQETSERATRSAFSARKRGRRSGLQNAGKRG